MEAAVAEGADAAAPRPRHQRQRPLRRSTPARPAPAASADRRIAAAEASRRQPPLPPAAAHPGVHGAALGGRRPDRRAATPCGRRRRSRTSCGRHARRGHRHPRAQAAGDRPGRRRRLRRQAAGHARGGALHCSSPAEAGQAGEVDRDPHRVAAVGPPRPRPDPGHRRSPPTATAPSPALQGRAARRHGRLPAPGHPGHPDPRRVHVQPASTSSRPTASSARNVFTNKTPTDAYRGAGRPEATFAIERIMDELAVELGMDPLELRAEELDQARGVPVHHGRRADLRLAATTRRPPRKAHGAVRLRRAAARAAASAASASDPVQLGIGISTFTEMCGLAPSRVLGSLSLRRRRLGARGDPDAADRQGRGRHRLVRRTGRATRRRGARSSPTSSACRSRTSRCCTATPRSRRAAWTPTARARWSSAAIARGQGRGEGGREGAQGRRAPAGGARGRPRVHRRARSRSGARSKGVTHPGGRAGHLRGAQPPRRAWSRSLDADATFDPENFSFPHGTHLVRDGGRHRDRPGRRSASTSASTTSARR